MKSNYSTFQEFIFDCYLQYLTEEKYPRSITEFSQKIGIDRTTCSLLLWGKKQPTKGVLEKLSFLYGNIVFQFVDQNIEHKLVRRVTKMFDKMSPDKKKEILSQIISAVKAN
jgi:hypothetical protein